MERGDTRWQLVLRTVLRGKRRRLFLFVVMMAGAGAVLQAAPQHFTVAIPAMEGPVTMGVFSEQGKLVRLLYRDARVETLPAGLNGLIMSWDGKDDQGTDVPSGTYRARGLVHGPLRATQIPFFTPLIPEEEPASPFPADRIVLRAAEDEILESRPLLSLHAVNRLNEITLEVEGLPLVTIPLTGVEGSVPAKALCNHGYRPGAAVMTAECGNFRESYVVLGLDRIVPIDAGKLEVSGRTPVDAADTSHQAVNAGESAP